MLSVSGTTLVVRPISYCSNQPPDVHLLLIGFDLSTIAHGVYNEAIIDIISPDSLASQPYLLKGLHFNSTTPRNLDFSSPFTLTSTTPKRIKIHAFVLYFDTLFTTAGDAVPPSVPVKMTKEGDVTLAEVWPVSGKPPLQRRASMGAGLKQKHKEDRRATSFNTGPDGQPTHWKQTVCLLRVPILAEEGTFLIFFMASRLVRFDGVGTIVAGTFY
jgi:protein arginine N-methyltransferase 3